MCHIHLIPTQLQPHPSLGPSEDDQAVTAALDKIGKSKNVSLTQIALAYVMAKQPCIFHIVGIRKIEHLRNNIDALKVRLSKKEIKEIEEAYDFKVDFLMISLVIIRVKIGSCKWQIITIG
jgi:aryl-alcohol dehydrogenase-like predicted oxidoreductase